VGSYSWNNTQRPGGLAVTAIVPTSYSTIMRPDSFKILALYKSFTYLLTYLLTDHFSGPGQALGPGCVGVFMFGQSLLNEMTFDL